MDSLIIELQRDALNEEISVSSLLRKAFATARKLKLQEFEKWITLELNGYYHLAELELVRPEDRWKELPKYRWVNGELRVRLPNQRSIPWVFESRKEAELLSKRPVLDSIGEIETILGHEGSSTFKITYPNNLKLNLYEHLKGNEPECVVFSYQFHRIQETVRNIILEWALKLEENGILGDGLAFSPQERETAGNITFNVERLIQGGTEMKVKMHNSTIGMLNTGEMRGESITANVSTLAASNQHQIAEAFQRLTEAVKASQNISSQQQTEILEQLELLSEQATLAPSERKAGLIKATLSALATTLSAGGGLAEIWSTWSGVIANFFGMLR